MELNLYIFIAIESYYYSYNIMQYFTTYLFSFFHKSLTTIAQCNKCEKLFLTVKQLKLIKLAFLKNECVNAF